MHSSAGSVRTRLLLLLSGVTFAITPAPAGAFPNGIATTSFPVPAQGCNFCHSGGSAPTVTLECVDCSTPASVDPLSTHEFKLTVTEIALQTHAGLNVSSASGTFAIGGSAAANTQTIVGSGSRQEITHTAPKPASSGVTEFSFLWTAPGSPGTVSLQAWGNAVNFNGNTGGDLASAASLNVVVSGDAPTPTATSEIADTATPTPTATPGAACPATSDSACLGGFERASLQVSEVSAGRETLSVKLSQGPALQQTDFGNPLSAAEGGTGTRYSLCLYGSDDVLAASLVVDRAGDSCVDKPCWRALGRTPADPRGPGRGYAYKDRERSSDGVQRMQLRAGDTGRSRVSLSGKGSNLPNAIPATLQSSSHIVVQIRASDGVCLTATLSDIRRQEPLRFQAR